MKTFKQIDFKYLYQTFLTIFHIIKILESGCQKNWDEARAYIYLYYCNYADAWSV